MRPFALALVACLACSRDPSGTADPIFHRDCAASIALRCSQLAIVTNHSPITTSSNPVGPLYARGGGFDAFEGPALLQHYVIDGAPPHFHATSNAYLLPGAGMATTSDGTSWFAYVGGSAERFRAWDTSNTNVADVVLGDGAENSGGIAAYAGLALIHHQDYGPTDRLIMLDTNGTTGWVATGALATSAPASYGCGFALVGNAELTTVPLDGRARMQQAVAMGSAVAWPYDAHAVAFPSYDVPPYYVPFDAATTCDARLTLAFDDGRAPITRTYPRDCQTLIDVRPAALVSTTFGAVMYFGNDELVLLDENANIVGAPVHVTMESAEPTLQLGAGGDWVVAIVSEVTPPVPVTTYETIIGCGN